jgi:hypothetical protein
MTRDQFWRIIEKIHRESGTDIDKRFEVLEAALGKLSLAEVQSFDTHFTDCHDRAYKWGLWGAAYVIGGGCSDDGFSDFRNTLITCGRKIFERALKDPDSLADLSFELGDSLQVEGISYIAGKVAVRLGGDVLGRSKPHPKKPAGKKWNEVELAKLCPRLTKTYGQWLIKRYGQ